MTSNIFDYLKKVRHRQTRQKNAFKIQNRHYTDPFCEWNYIASQNPIKWAFVCICFFANQWRKSPISWRTGVRSFPCGLYAKIALQFPHRDRRATDTHKLFSGMNIFYPGVPHG